MATTEARREIDKLIHSEVRTNRMPHVQQFTTTSRPIPTTGLIINPHTSASPMPEIRPIFTGPNMSAGTAQKRRNDSVNDDNEGPAKKRKRGPRTCQKCGRKGVEEAKLAGEEGCPGNTGSAKCVFACRDCRIQGPGCSGRNSRKPNKPCENVNK